MAITTIAEAKAYLNKNYGKGCNCPACNSFVKEYKRPLSSSMAYALILIYRYHLSKNVYGQTFTYFHVERYLKSLPGISSTIRGDFTKLRYWGLIRQETREHEGKLVEVPGMYSITPKGTSFVFGGLKVPERVITLQDKFRGFCGPEITIKDALENKFNYEELMKL